MLKSVWPSLSQRPVQLPLLLLSSLHLSNSADVSSSLSSLLKTLKKWCERRKKNFCQNKCLRTSAFSCFSCLTSASKQVFPSISGFLFLASQAHQACTLRLIENLPLPTVCLSMHQVAVAAGGFRASASFTSWMCIGTSTTFPRDSITSLRLTVQDE